MNKNDFLGLFVPDQNIRLLNPEGRTLPDELLRFIQSPGRDPFRDRAFGKPGEPDPEFDDFRWPICSNRYQFLADASIRRLCVTELGGVGKSQLLEELEYLTATLHPDHIVMRFNLAVLPPKSPHQVLDERCIADNSFFVERFKTEMKDSQAIEYVGSDFDPTSLIRNHMERGLFTWIIDGIDQLNEADAKDRMENVVSKILEWYPKIRCVIAGRPYAIQRIWDEAGLGVASGKPAKPVWQFCILERFSIQSESKRPSQAQRYLSPEIWNAVQHLEADELSLPRTLNILRSMRVADARGARTASEIYWRVISRSNIESLENVRKKRSDVTLTAEQLRIVLGAISLGMMIFKDSPITEITGVEDVNKFLDFLEDQGFIARIQQERCFRQSSFEQVFDQIKTLGDASIRFHAYSETEGTLRHLEITDPTIRDFYAAHFASRYIDEKFDEKQAGKLAYQFARRNTKIFEYPEETSDGGAYARYWKLFVEIPSQIQDDFVSNKSAYARMVRPVFMSRETLRPTEVMYRAWPELLLRSGYLAKKHFSQEEFLHATTRVQQEVWKKVFPYQEFGDASAIDCNCPIKNLLFEFLGEYPLLYRAEIDAGQADGLVTWYENGFRYIPSGEVHYGNEDKPRTIASPFRLNAYQTTNDVYQLFDPLHWKAMKPGEAAPGSCFGYSEDYSPESKCPAIGLTWFDAWAFSTWVGGRLPNEVEWEGAARGTIGMTDAPRTEFYYGDVIEDTSEFAGLEHYGWFYKNSGSRSQPVGGFATRPKELPPNKEWVPHTYCVWDVHGNVWEWCQDWWNEASQSRVVVGGSFHDPAEVCACSTRYSDFPAVAGYDLGVRVARVQ